jgi:starvation-inducible DNA-binding protein
VDRRADDAVRYFVGVLEKLGTRLRARILATEDDQVTQDLLIEISAVLEKHYWMWQAQSIA